MCRAMKRSDALRKRWIRGNKDAPHKRRWLRGGKGTKSACRCPIPLLRPVNVRGHRARGMRAPENTNQFLMTEKYRLHALRSDSVDSGSDGSDAELADMDAYLGAWEDAHGALLDQDTEGKGESGGRGETEETILLVEERDERRDRGAHERGEGGRTLLFADTDENSAQYFPSEDDLNLSDNFMHRDFTEFCLFVTS